MMRTGSSSRTETLPRTTIWKATAPCGSMNWRQDGNEERRFFGFAACRLMPFQ